VYVKGAPEEVVPLCKETLNADVEPVTFSKEDELSVLQQVVSTEMAQVGLKPLTYAFKQIRVDYLNNLLQKYPQESDDFR